MGELPMPEGMRGTDAQVSGDRIAWQGHQYPAGSNGGDHDIFTWTPEGGTVQLTANDTNEGVPQVSGDRIIWLSYPQVRDNRSNLFTWTPEGGPVQIAENVADDWRYCPPQVSGDRVVWIGKTNPLSTHPMYDEVFTWTPEGGTVQITNNNTSGEVEVQVSGDRVAWARSAPMVGANPSALALYEAFTWTPEGGTVQISKPLHEARIIRISGDRIVWHDRNYETWRPDVSGMFFPYGVVTWTPEGGTVPVRIIGANDGVTGWGALDVSGDRVVWSEGRGLPTLKTLYTWTPAGGTMQVPPSPLEVGYKGVEDRGVEISGDRIVWTNANGRNVWTWTPTDGTVQVSALSARYTAVSGDRIVWPLSQYGGPIYTTPWQTITNTAPVAVDDQYTVEAGTQLTIPGPGVLGNDTDADADMLTAHLAVGVSNGTLVLGDDGGFIYTPAAGFSGTDSFTFTYRAHDGTDYSNVVTVTITVLAPPTGTITLFEWNDSDSDGQRDAGELPLEGEVFNLEGVTPDGSSVATSGVTEADGSVVFDDLTPGDYSVEGQTVALELNPDGTVVEPGWRASTDETVVIALEPDAHESASFGSIQFGWIEGRVTHPLYGHGMPGVKVDLEETNETTYTNEDGYYFFYELEPNGTTAWPTPDYTVGIDLSGTSLVTSGVVNESVTVQAGASGRVDSTVYEDAEAWGNAPRTIGYWKNWKNHYTADEMQTLLDKVNAGSTEFAILELEDVRSVLQFDGQTTMQEKARGQFLATWLNVASGNLGLDTRVNVSATGGWAPIVESADENGWTKIQGFIRDIEVAFSADGWATDAWETIKNLLDGLNNGLIS